VFIYIHSIYERIILSIKVPNLYSDTTGVTQQRKDKRVSSQVVSIPMTGSRVKATKIDKSNDGKFSFSEAAKNFGKGLISPITGMFQSKKTFAKAALMIVGSAVLIAATGGAATPFLIAAGVGMGACQAAKGAYKIVKAKNGDDIEKAFYDIGGATGTIGLSVMGAKGALKSAGMSTKGLNPLSATAKCFTSSKSLAVESLTTFKNGYFKTNLSNTIKPLFQPKFKRYSKEFFNEGQRNFKEAFDETKEILPEEMKPLLTGRAKGLKSIYSKVIDGCIMKSKIKQALKRTDLTDLQKNAEVIRLKKEAIAYKKDMNVAKPVVNDLIGTRLTLKDCSKEAISKLVESIIEAINNDKIVISEIRNYRGPNGKFYFTEEQITAIKSAGAAKKMEISVLKANKQIKSSGYNAVQLKIKHKNGSIGELQIRGSKVDAVAEYEHIPYDLRTGKDITRGSNKIAELLNPFKKAVKKLTDEQYVEYEKYLAKTYKCARREELGLTPRKAELPEGFDPILSTENLKLLHEKTSILPTKMSAPLSPVSQTAVSYNFLNLTNKDDKKNKKVLVK